MASVHVRCPGCSRPLRGEACHVGKKMRCPNCKTSFVFTSGGGGTDRPADTATPDPREVAEDGVPAVWKVGDVILDLYEVTGVCGAGGMGMVHRVRHKKWNTDLAVKSPRAESFTSERHKENFEREAEVWVNLGLHPHVVSCHYVRRLGGIPRLFAEFVAGGSLAHWIRSGKLYEGGHEEALARILDVAIQFAWGLGHAHEQGLVHQDVKPDNVLLTPGGGVKVADFGLAKARGMTAEETLGGTQRSVLVSSGGMTVPYASPEQFNKQPLSRKTDI